MHLACLHSPGGGVGSLVLKTTASESAPHLKHDRPSASGQRAGRGPQGEFLEPGAPALSTLGGLRQRRALRYSAAMKRMTRNVPKAIPASIRVKVGPNSNHAPSIVSGTSRIALKSQPNAAIKRLIIHGKPNRLEKLIHVPFPMNSSRASGHCWNIARRFAAKMTGKIDKPTTAATKRAASRNAAPAGFWMLKFTSGA